MSTPRVKGFNSDTPFKWRNPSCSQLVCSRLVASTEPDLPCQAHKLQSNLQDGNIRGVQAMTFRPCLPRRTALGGASCTVLWHVPRSVSLCRTLSRLAKTWKTMIGRQLFQWDQSRQCDVFGVPSRLHPAQEQHSKLSIALYCRQVNMSR